MLVWKNPAVVIWVAAPDGRDELASELVDSLRQRLHGVSLPDVKALKISRSPIDAPFPEVPEAQWSFVVALLDAAPAGAAPDFESWASERVAEGYQVLPVRIGTRQQRHSLVELDWDDLGADGIAEMLVRRLTGSLTEDAPGLNISKATELDLKGLESLLAYLDRRSVAPARTTLDLNLILPPYLREMRNAVVEATKTGRYPAAVEIATSIIDEENRRLPAEISRAVLRVMSSVQSFDLAPSAALATLELFILAKVLSLALRVSRADLPFPGLPNWLEPLRRSGLATAHFEGALICLLQARGWREEFWFAAELEEDTYMNRRHSGIYAPASLLFEAAVRPGHQMTFQKVFYDVLAPQILAADQDDVEYTLAFPDRFQLRTSRRRAIDATTLEMGSRYRPLRAEVTRRAADRFLRLLEEEDPTASADALALQVKLRLEGLGYLERL